MFPFVIGSKGLCYCYSRCYQWNTSENTDSLKHLHLLAVRFFFNVLCCDLLKTLENVDSDMFVFQQTKL